MAKVSTNKKANRAIFAASIVVCVYFYTMFFIATYRSDYTLIGVLIEILTIPMLILLAISMILSIIQLIKEKFSSLYPIFSLTLLLAVILGFAMM